MPGHGSEKSFDYVIVGAGAAGSVLAARLSEDPSVTVCVIEAGPSELRPYVHIPAGFIKTLSQDAVTWKFRTEPTPNTGDRGIATTQGRIVGGSGSINGMIYVRGQPQDYDHWAQLGNRGWGYEDILPYFQRSERRIGADPDGVRGRDGPIPVTDMNWFHPVADAFIDAAVAQGIPRNPDYNGRRQEGIAYAQRMIERGVRRSSAATFLRPALRRRNLKLITNARATRIGLTGDRADTVYYARTRAGPETALGARREVILCCGSINTPRLLQISGIGPADLLASLGIEIRLALPGVGGNLADHFSARMSMRARPHVVTLNELGRFPRLLGEIARWTLGRPSILELVPSPIYAFCRSRPELDLPDLQCAFTPGSYQVGRHYVLDDYPGVTAGTWAHRPLSRGHVHARSSDVWVDPLVQPNYLDHDADKRTIVAGMKLIRAILHSPILEPWLEKETSPGADVASDDALLDFCRRNGSTTYHLVGTSRMGPASDKASVVDDRLRVHGLYGLRVADASIMPNITSANTYATTLMIAEKAADMIRADARG